MKSVFKLSMILCLIILLAGCKTAEPPEPIKRIAIDSMEGVLTKTGVSFDKENSNNGNGSLKIEASQPATVRLYVIKT